MENEQYINVSYCGGLDRSSQLFIPLACKWIIQPLPIDCGVGHMTSFAIPLPSGMHRQVEQYSGSQKSS